MKTYKTGIEQFATVTEEDSLAAAPSPSSTERRTARLAGAVFLLEAGFRMLNVFGRLSMMGRFPVVAVATGLIGSALPVILFGVPATWLLRGRLIHRRLALIGPIFSAAVYAVVSTRPRRDLSARPVPAQCPWIIG